MGVPPDALAVLYQKQEQLLYRSYLFNTGCGSLSDNQFEYSIGGKAVRDSFVSLSSRGEGDGEVFERGAEGLSNPLSSRGEGWGEVNRFAPFSKTPRQSLRVGTGRGERGINGFRIPQNADVATLVEYSLYLLGDTRTKWEE